MYDSSTCLYLRIHQLKRDYKILYQAQGHRISKLESACPLAAHSLDHWHEQENFHSLNALHSLALITAYYGRKRTT